MIFKPPYTPAGKTSFGQALKKSGIYVIKENGKIVYIGHSKTNLYRTMYRHFQTWNHRGQEVVSYQSRLRRNSYTVAIEYHTPAAAARREKELIIKYQPRDNEMKYRQAVLRFTSKKKKTATKLKNINKKRKTKSAVYYKTDVPY